MTTLEQRTYLRHCIKAQEKGIQGRIARTIGITDSHLSSMLSGRSPMGPEHFDKIMQALNLSGAQAPGQKERVSS